MPTLIEEAFSKLELFGLTNQVINNIANKTAIDKLSDCWLYENQDYPRIYYNNRLEFLHRIISHLYHGLILDSNLLSLHKLQCINKNCWNPDHLYVGTNKDNTQDSLNVGTFVKHESLKTHCKYGHEYTPENTRWQGNKRHCRECKRLKRNPGPRKRSRYSSTKIKGN